MVALKLTPDLLRSVYVALTNVSSIAKLPLPDEDSLIFEILRTEDRFGDYEWVAGRHVIRVSSAVVGSWESLTATIAHEQIHIAGRLMGVKGWDHHGAWFKKLAKPVCQELGFDLKAF